jgi:hypothetical protein
VVSNKVLPTFITRASNERQASTAHDAEHFAHLSEGLVRLAYLHEACHTYCPRKPEHWLREVDPPASARHLVQLKVELLYNHGPHAAVG